MGRARVVSPPPENYIPEPLVSAPEVEESTVEEVEEEVENETTWTDGSMLEEQAALEAARLAEEERERIAKEQYEILQQKKAEDALREQERERMLAEAEEILKNPPVKVVNTIEHVYVPDPNLVAEVERLKKECEELRVNHANQTPAKANQVLLKQLEQLTAENAQLKKRSEDLEKVKTESILKARQQTTDQKKIQLNLIKQEKPSIKSRLKDWWKKRKQLKATEVKSGDYQHAIMQRAIYGIPRILDDMEKIHDELTILEMLLKKQTSGGKNR